MFDIIHFTFYIIFHIYRRYSVCVTWRRIPPPNTRHSNVTVVLILKISEPFRRDESPGRKIKSRKSLASPAAIMRRLSDSFIRLRQPGWRHARVTFENLCGWPRKIPATNAKYQNLRAGEETSIINRKRDRNETTGGVAKNSKGCPRRAAKRTTGVYPAKVLRGFRYSFSAHVWRRHDVRAPNWIRLVGLSASRCSPASSTFPRRVKRRRRRGDTVPEPAERSEPLSQNLTRIRWSIQSNFKWLRT